MKKKIIKDTDLINEILSINSLEKGLSKNTISAYKLDVNLTLEWLSKKKIKLLEAKEDDFIEYFTFLRSKNYKANSLTRKLSSISQFYQTLKDENYITNNSDSNMTQLLNDLSLKVTKPTTSTPADEVLFWNNTSSALETKSWDAAGVFEVTNNGTEYVIQVKSALAP